MHGQSAWHREVDGLGIPRRRRRFLARLLGIAGYVSLAACTPDRITAFATSDNWDPGTATHAVTVSGVTRTFLVHIPPVSSTTIVDTDAQPNASMPLVIVLHGSSGDGEAIRASSQMDSLADARGFVVAYPNGSDGGFGLYPTDWNAGTCCGAPFREGVDDLAFISTVIASVEARVTIDRSRIFVAGFSDGGRMTYHIACQLGSKIAAIAVVSGSLTDDQCFPSAGVPLLAIHGTSDDQVPYDDDSATPVPGRVPDMATELPSSVQFWVAENGCGDGTLTRVTEHTVRASFDPCSNADVVLYSIQGGSHGWPGEPGSDGAMAELKASELIVDFFSHHTRR